MRVTFFVRTVVGYVSWPQAAFALGLASALADSGHDVRVVEPRRNDDYVATLRAVGSEPARRIFRDLPKVQHHTYEPRSGVHLLEWFTRELALLDVAVAVDGVDHDLCALLAGIIFPGLTRTFVGFDQPAIPAATVESLGLGRLDLVLAPTQPAGLPNWSLLRPTLPDVDTKAWKAVTSELPDVTLAAPADVASAFERAVRDSAKQI